MPPTIPAGWKPIESAPKDGTEILAWREDCGQFIASYTSADSFPMTQDELDAWDEETLFAKDWFTQWPQAYRLEGIEVPTHWMPLPADPSAKTAPACPWSNVHPDCAAAPSPLSAAPASAQEEAKRERQAFEAWHKREFGSYVPEVTNHYNRWLGWEGRASVAAPAAGDALDAKRYRKLRRKVCIAGGQFHILNLAPTYVAPDAAVELDSMLDAALAAQVPQQGEA